MRYTNFDGSDDTLDSRDILERIEELTAEFIDATEGDPGDTMTVDDWKVGLSEDDAEELAALIDFRNEEDGNYGDSFEDGVIFIHEDYFTEAMRELCQDIGAVPADTPGFLAIDWDETADNLRVDYTSAQFRGVTYWAR